MGKDLSELASYFLPLAEARSAVTYLLDRRLRRQARMLCHETASELAVAVDVPAVVQLPVKPPGPVILMLCPTAAVASQL